jgi:hypothetical protein
VPAGAAVFPAEVKMGAEQISRRDAEELAECFTARARDLFGYACVIARGDRALADDRLVSLITRNSGPLLACSCDGRSPR